MNDAITLDPGSEAVLGALQALFGSCATVSPVPLNRPDIVEEFRPGHIKGTDLDGVPKPALDWAFGVECGAIHVDARFCALLFTQFARLEAFYALNPALHGTLVTCWNGAAAIWLRATGRIPRGFTADGVRWSIGGIIPVGCPRQAPETFVSQAGEIKRVEFGQLLWTEQQQAEIERVFVEMEVGPPFRTVTRGRRVLNMAFWAKYFTDMMPITYDPGRDLFAWGDPKVRQPVVLTVDETTREFANLMQAAAPSFGAQFPQGEIRPARIRQLVERIKVLVQQARVSDAVVLDAFLTERLTRTPGKDITSQELRAGYLAYCQGRGRAPCSASRFYRLLRAALHGLGINQRHDVLREGKRVRGYCGLTLKDCAQINPPDGTDASDASDASDGA